MRNSMSLTTRRELLNSVRQKYRQANWTDKGKILDGFVATANYDRKYAIRLLNDLEVVSEPKPRRSKVYDEQVLQALITVWCTANQICSKRLVPFLPNLVLAMEQHRHLRLPADVRKRLLSLSAATADRMLRPERESRKMGVSTTRRGSLLKHQIQIRTFADWDDVTPGFLEADLVAHCGGNTNGPFLNTLVLVDISTGWLECMPLLRKSASDVIDGLRVADGLLPFTLQGLDTDCGSEFINYELLDFCEEHQITFTRARTHRKNDQAHVEEKNGSVVRRLVGYDRFEGLKAWQALAELYSVLRRYVNFFQPSLKLLEKHRDGAKVSKKYDLAKTPYQRLMLSEHITQGKKDSLTSEYESIDPVKLLAQLEAHQDALWAFSWHKNGRSGPDLTVMAEDVVGEMPTKPNRTADRYYHLDKKMDLRSAPRLHRTRKDPFEKVWDEVRLRLELQPEVTAKAIIFWLMKKYPGQYATLHIRTMQRRIKQWRQDQTSQEEKMREIMMKSVDHQAVPFNVALTNEG